MDSAVAQQWGSPLRHWEMLQSEVATWAIDFGKGRNPKLADGETLTSATVTVQRWEDGRDVTADFLGEGDVVVTDGVRTGTAVALTLSPAGAVPGKYRVLVQAVSSVAGNQPGDGRTQLTVYQG